MVIDDMYRAQITGLRERRAKITSPLTLMSLKTTIIGKRPYETIQIQFSEKVNLKSYMQICLYRTSKSMGQNDSF